MKIQVDLSIEDLIASASEIGFYEMFDLIEGILNRRYPKSVFPIEDPETFDPPTMLDLNRRDPGVQAIVLLRMAIQIARGE